MKWRGEYLGFEVTVEAESEKEAKEAVFQAVMSNIRDRLKEKKITVKNISEDENNEE